MTEPDDSQMIYYKVIDRHVQQAPWLTMVHGFTHNHHYFSAQVAAFQKYFRLFLIDLRGHGQSAHLPGPYGIEEYTDDLVMALDSAGIGATHYWGTHTGSAVGLALALRAPERLLSLVLEGTFLPGFSMPRVEELLDRVRAITQSHGLEEALEDWFTNADWFEYIRNHPDQCRAEEHRRMVFKFKGSPLLSSLAPRPVIPFSESLHTIHQPTLLYNGEQDMQDFKRAAFHLARELPNARRVEIPNAGGFPGWEAPHAVNPVVREFLQDLM